MSKLKFLNITEAADCRFSGNFNFVDDNGNVKNLPGSFTVRVTATCKSERPIFTGIIPTFGLNEVCVLNVDENSVLINTQGFTDTSPVPDEDYVFFVEVVNIKKIEDECSQIKLKWSSYHYKKTVALTRPFIFKGDVKFPFGNAKGRISILPNLSGEFIIEVCCNETDDGCMTSCSLIT